PLDIESVQHRPNARPPMGVAAPADAVNPADKGDGREITVVERPPYSGTGSEIDAPAAFVKLKKKNSDESLGTYLVTVSLPDSKQTVHMDGKDYRLSMR